MVTMMKTMMERHYKYVCQDSYHHLRGLADYVHRHLMFLLMCFACMEVCWKREWEHWKCDWHCLGMLLDAMHVDFFVRIPFRKCFWGIRLPELLV